MDIDDEEGLTPVPTLQRQSSREEVFFTTDEYDDAVELAIKDPLGAADKLKKLVQKQESGEEMHNKTLRMKEEAIYKICAIYAKANDAAKVKQVMVDIRPFFKQIAKSRAAKIGTSCRRLPEQFKSLSKLRTERLVCRHKRCRGSIFPVGC